MISPARFREIKQIIQNCPPGEPVSLDKTSASALLQAAAVGMMAELERRAEIAGMEAKMRSNHPPPGPLPRPKGTPPPGATIPGMMAERQQGKR